MKLYHSFRVHFHVGSIHDPRQSYDAHNAVDPEHALRMVQDQHPGERIVLIKTKLLS